MAYVILINDENELYGSHKERIMQRSTGVDSLIFITDYLYKKTHDMTNATVMLEYVLPCSKRYRSEILELSEERYNDCFLQYKLPLTTKLTSEAGKIELQITFVYTEMDVDGSVHQRVRKTSPTTIEVIPISAWSDIIPDEVLTPLDQRLIVLSAQTRAIEEYLDVLDENQVDDLIYNDKEETLQLSANGVGIGSKVSVKDMLDDGVPVIDLNSNSGSNNDSDNNDNNDKDGCDCGCDCEDNVVEFGDVVAPEKPKEDENNVVEF